MRIIYSEKEKIVQDVQGQTGWHFNKLIVYVLVNFDFTFEQDLERVYLLRDMGYLPYIMIYDKEHTDSKSNVGRLQRWVNNRMIFRSVERFEDYIS